MVEKILKGETTFYMKDKKTVKFVCKPKMGSGAFFYSQQFHEGNKIISMLSEPPNSI